MKNSVRVALVLLVLLPSSALAGTFFVGGGAGQSQLRDTLRGGTFSGDDTAYKVFAGYRFARVVAVEAGYTDFGSFSGVLETDSVRVDLANAAFWGSGHFPIGKMFLVLVKLGAVYTEADFTRVIQGETESDKTSDWDLGWGVGVGLNLGKHFTIRLEWEDYQTSTVQNLEVASLGVQVNF
jgi:OOP family OmpA-OmpF porin